MDKKYCSTNSEPPIVEEPTNCCSSNQETQIEKSKVLRYVVVAVTR